MQLTAGYQTCHTALPLNVGPKAAPSLHNGPRCSHTAPKAQFSSYSRTLNRVQEQRTGSRLRAAADADQWWTQNTDLWTLAQSGEEFDSIVQAAGDRLVVVDFFGANCKGCMKMEPDLNKIAADPAFQQTCKFVKMKIDGQKDFARREKVKVIPYIGFYTAQGGKLAGYQTVPQRVKHLRANIQTLLANPGKHFTADPNDFLVVSEAPTEQSESGRLMQLLEMQKKASEQRAHLQSLGKKST